MNDSQESGAPDSAAAGRRRFAWMAILAADAGLLAWAVMAAFAPDQLLGPGGAPIVAAGYEGFTHQAWAELAEPSRGFITVLFRTYGAYGVALALLAIAITVTAFRRGEHWAWWALLVGNTIGYGAAMTYDQVVHAIGPFEMLEYVGLALVYVALAVTAPFGSDSRAGAGRSPS